ncbi:hypothetical protein DIPPA_19287 [Diplonema papillatum]|nr:hypothetical protein DIPPA_19287 [Diplonema papillatum]
MTLSDHAGEEAELYSLCDVVLPEAVLAAGEQSEYAAGGDEAGEGAFPGVVPERAVRVLERLSATLGCGPGAVRFSRFRPLMLPPAAPTLRAAADGRQLIPRLSAQQDAKTSKKPI